MSEAASSPASHSFPATYLVFLVKSNQRHLRGGNLHDLIPLTQYGQRRCALFTFPHAEHLFRLVTSFRAFPAMNLCRFLRCDVFFLGTARSIDSHIPESMEGSLRAKVVGGAAKRSEGNGLYMYCPKRSADLD